MVMELIGEFVIYNLCFYNDVAKDAFIIFVFKKKARITMKRHFYISFLHHYVNEGIMIFISGFFSSLKYIYKYTYIHIPWNMLFLLHLLFI